MSEGAKKLWHSRMEASRRKLSMRKVLTIITTRQIDNMDEFEGNFRQSHTQLFGSHVMDDLIKTIKEGKDFEIKSKDVVTTYRLETQV